MTQVTEEHEQLCGVSAFFLCVHRTQTWRLCGGAAKRPVSPYVASPRSVLVRTPDHAAVHKELGERGIICDFRPDAGVRLGPHFFNTEDELRHTVDVLAELVASGAYERHQGAAARF